jgi:two-component system, LuxR family, response regulator FixJ
VTESGPTVFIVDDDMPVRQSLQLLLQSVKINVAPFGSGREFLDLYDSEQSGCALLDLRMPHISGIELLRRLRAAGHAIPVIMMSGHADVTIAVQCMKAGAVDFFEKPFCNETMLECIHGALALDLRQRHDRAEEASMQARLAIMTTRERQVGDLITAGLTNKESAAQLGISCKTVEVHRARFMHKLQADSLPAAVEMLIRFGDTERVVQPIRGRNNLVLARPARQAARVSIQRVLQ